MASTFSLTPTVEVFPCPNCRQTINTTASVCPFCGTAIDPAAAQASAAETTRISAACSDASYLKIMAWGILMFLGLSFVPFVGAAGGLGLWFLRFAIPFMSARWWIMYRDLRSPDPDLARARRIAIVVSVIAVLLLFNLVYLGFSINHT